MLFIHIPFVSSVIHLILFNQQFNLLFADKKRETNEKLVLLEFVAGHKI